MSKFIVDFMVSVEVEVTDPRVIARCVDNDDNWRGTFYDISTPEQVAEHLAYNYAANSVDEVNRLDGWADLPAGTVKMRTLGEWEVERVEVEEPYMPGSGGEGVRSDSDG